MVLFHDCQCPAPFLFVITFRQSDQSSAGFTAKSWLKGVPLLIENSSSTAFYPVNGSRKSRALIFRDQFHLIKTCGLNEGE